MSYTPQDKQTIKHSAVATVVSGVVYCGIAWGINKLLDGGREEFLWTLGILMGLRAAYGLADFTAGIITWRVFGRRLLVSSYVALLRECKMPKRAFCTDDVSNYLGRIIEPGATDYRNGSITPELQRHALEIKIALECQQGILVDARKSDAMRRALEIYSPAEDSPPSGCHYALRWINSAAKASEIEELWSSGPELAKGITAKRPFETHADLYHCLRENGLGRMQAVSFLNAANNAGEASNNRRH